MCRVNPAPHIPCRPGRFALGAHVCLSGGGLCVLCVARCVWGGGCSLQCVCVMWASSSPSTRVTWPGKSSALCVKNVVSCQKTESHFETWKCLLPAGLLACLAFVPACLLEQIHTDNGCIHVHTCLGQSCAGWWCRGCLLPVCVCVGVCVCACVCVCMCVFVFVWFMCQN